MVNGYDKIITLLSAGYFYLREVIIFGLRLK